MSFIQHITYRNDFTNEIEPGYRDCEWFISKRRVVAKCDRFPQGASISFEVEELGTKEIVDSANSLSFFDHTFTRYCREFTFYYHESNQEQIKFCRNIKGIAEERITGQSATDMIYDLFFRLIIKGNEPKFHKWIPKHMEFITQLEADNAKT